MSASDAIEKLISIAERQDENSLVIANALSDLALAMNRLADKDKDSMSAGDMLERYSQMKAYEANLGVVDASNGQSTEYKTVNVYTHNKIVESGKEYTRNSHPLLFSVVDYLETNESARNIGVRVIAEKFTHDTGQSVSKSWAAVAKNYWQNK